jgi:hypothetical protein
MTIHEAYVAAVAIFPAQAKYISVEQDCTVDGGGVKNEFYIWNGTRTGDHIAGHSQCSWEHALHIARGGNKDAWPEDNSPVAAEGSATS